MNHQEFDSAYENIGFKIENDKLELIFPKFMKMGVLEITIESIKIYEKNDFDRNLIDSLKLLLNKIFTKDDFEKILIELNLSDKQKDLVIENAIRHLKEKEFFYFYNIFKKYQKDYVKQSSIKNKDDNFKIMTGLISKNNIDFSIIETYFSLIEDYKSNGLLLFSQIKNNYKPQGNINWQKTINKSQALQSNENIFYNDIYFKNLNFNYNHPVTLLYAYALLIVSKKLNFKINLNYDYKFLKQLQNSKSLIENILKKYKKEMFSDRNKRIFIILENIFLNTKYKNNLSKKGESLYYVENFNMLWEKMIAKTLFYEPFKNIMPQGKYFIQNNNDIKETSGINPLLDLVFREKYNAVDYLIVLDAKNYISETNLPATKDITKQIMYKYFLSKEFDQHNEFELDKIINAFILPYNDNISAEKIKYIGIHRFIDKFSSNKLGMVFCFHVNFSHLRDAYLNKNNTYEYKKEIVDFIIKTYCEKILLNQESIIMNNS